MRPFDRFRFQFLFDNPADGGAGGGAPASGGSGGGTPPAAPAQGGGAPAGGTPAAAAPTGGGTSAFTYPEDRSRWVPPYRLEEQNRRYQELERRYGGLEGRVRALMGLEQPQDPRGAEIRAALMQVMPELGMLLDPRNGSQLQRVLELAQSGQLDNLLSSDSAGWSRHAFQMTNSAVDAYAKAVGVPADKLPQRALTKLASELKGFIEEDGSGQRLQRYEAGDPRLIGEFIEDLTGFFIAPVRQAQTQLGAQLADRNRRLPSAGPKGGVPPQGGAQKKSREEISAAARQFVLENQ